MHSGRDLGRDNQLIVDVHGNVDVICDGPPCQGIVVFMDIVEFLKPTYILMENVVDILRLADAQLGKYAIGNIKQVLELWLLVATAFHNSVFVFSYGEFILMRLAI